MPRSLLSLLLAACLAIASGAVAAQSRAGDQYPNHPIRFVVPWPAGGGSDAIARIIAAKLGESMGQMVWVENKPGVSGVLGTDIVAKSAKDGYTLVLVVSNHVTSPMLRKQVPYDPLKDFAPIAIIGYTPFMFVVNPGVPVKNMQELAAYAKARPGKVTFASPGHGTSHHLGMQLFLNMAGIEMLHVPYKGGAPAINDLLGGQVNVYLETINGVEPLVRAGKLRALGVSTLQRVPVVPDVPTIAESGFPGYEIVGYWGVLAPAGTPSEVVAKLNLEINKALARPDTRESLRSLALVYEPEGSTPEKFRAFLERQIPKYAKLIKDAGIEPE